MAGNLSDELRRTVIIVAHDRYFLDRVVTKIVELDGGIATFSRAITPPTARKAIIRAGVLKAYLNQQQEIRHRGRLSPNSNPLTVRNPSSAPRAVKNAFKMDLLEKPTEINDAMHITLEPCVTSGNDVLSVRELAKSFDGMTLFTDLNFEVKRGERIAIIGNNGTGKTTILKMINGLRPRTTADPVRFQRCISVTTIRTPGSAHGQDAL